MNVGSILGGKGNAIISVAETASIQDVVKLMGEKRIGAVIVTNESGKLCGIISERDVVRELAKQGGTVMEKTVTSCMTSNVVRTTEDDSVGHVLQTMTEGRFRHLPVMRNEELIGLISIGDVVKSKIEEAERDAAEMRNYIAS